MLLALGLNAPAAQARPRIVNGVFTSAYATTGALVQGSTLNNVSSWCSGTLIGCRTFLTAQHCVEGYTAADFKVFLQHGGIYDVESIAVAPGYDFPVADVAVLTLAEPVTGISPSKINTIQDPPFGSDGTIAGFGRSGGNNDDYGLKRLGKVTTSACGSGVSNATSVCWTYDANVGPAGTDSNTCNADSGGPLFLTLGGQEVVAGITSGGSSDNCLPSDNSYDADVYFYRNFILSAGGDDLARSTCGDISQVGDGGTSVHGFSGQLTTTQVVHSFSVPASSALLRVTMNADDDGINDFDLYVRAGSAPTTSVFDCARVGGNQYGSCEFTNPAAGTWYAMVYRYTGSGSYQVTATAFAPGCSDPLNAGKACDDGNACTADDQCSGGICQGTSLPEDSSCGDGDLCSGPLTCQSGACVGSGTPRTDCKRSTDPVGSSLFLHGDDVPSRQKLTWKWARGVQTLDFGDPTSTTDYAVCLYDGSGGSDSLIMTHLLPAGSGWTASPTGFRYADRTAAQSGIRSVKLKRGVDGRASIHVTGKGAGLPMTTLPLQQDPEVRVQFVSSDSGCWESHYSTNTVNDGISFKAKGR